MCEKDYREITRKGSIVSADMTTKKSTILIVEDDVALNEQVKLFKEPLPQAPAPKPKPSLNSQVAPNTSSASTPSADPTGRIWTAQEYANALDHRNLQRMNREEYDALVAEAEQAYSEGRVRF